MRSRVVNFLNGLGAPVAELQRIKVFGGRSLNVYRQMS